MDLMAFTWSAMASGAIGGAAYDALKALLGNSFDRLAGYAAKDQAAKFEEVLEILLESNATLRAQLTALASGGQTNITTITTGDIDVSGGGRVIVGNGNKMG